MDKIIIFSLPSPGNNYIVGYAVTENGETITQHTSSNAEWLKIDMTDSNKREIYKQRFPNGYILEYSNWAPSNWDGFGHKDAPKLALNITLDDGKYTVQIDEKGRMWALRYGESWRDLTGDKLICAMAHEIETLRKKLDDAEFNLAHTGW